MFDFLKPKPKQADTGPADTLLQSVGSAVSAATNAVAGGASPADGKYTVQAGDSLSKIAKKHGIALSAIIAANPQIKNPDLIHPKQVVNLG